MQSKLFPIVVLNDGESWAHAAGSEILHITEEAMDKLEEGEPVYMLVEEDVAHAIRLESND
jgi:hypothetical protein